MIDDLALRWVVTGLFALSAAQWAFAIITQRRVWTAIVRYALHFVMSVAMAMMIWPWGPQLPTMESAVFFLLASTWFVIATAFLSERTIAKRAEYGYHALMMLAMAWMFAGMNRHLLSGVTPMPGMPATGESAGWITMVNRAWFGGLVVATFFWVYRFAAERSHGSFRRWWLDSLGQAMMAAGMAIAFGAMLFQG